MTKREIIIKIADDAGMKQVEVKKIIQKTLDYIISTLAKGETVELRNFGIFKVKSRKARTGRNPRTGESIPISGKKAVRFKAGLIMKEKLNK